MLEKTLDSGIDETKPICKIARVLNIGEIISLLNFSNDGAMACGWEFFT